MEARLQVILTLFYMLTNLFTTTVGNILFCRRINPCKKNIRLKNCIKGKRCFVLGNGPSLSKQNLSMLDGEIVFTVNQVLRNKQYGHFKSSFHFWMDNNFFVFNKLNPEDEELQEIMRKTANQSNVKCFYPYNKKQYLIENDIPIDNAFFLFPMLKIDRKSVV